MKRPSIILGLLALLLLSPFSALAADPFDVVIRGGRVIDPETLLDGVRDVGLRGGKIAAVSEQPLDGKVVIDAAGLVVAPGFVDLHSHAQQLPGARMQAFDGVTTALELESGILPVAAWYDAVGKEGRPINYGASAGWTFARISAFQKIEPRADLAFFFDAFKYKEWTEQLASPEQLKQILALVEQGIRDGAIGVGINNGYAPRAGRKEYHALNALAARYGVPTFTHVRFMSVEEPQSSFEAYQEVIAVAATTGGHIHVCHLNSTSLRDIEAAVDLIKAAQARGIRITVEAYPYPAASTAVGAPMFRGPRWRERLGGLTTADMELLGKPLNDEMLFDLQANDAGVPIVFNYLKPKTNPADQKFLDLSVLYPGGALASDAMPWSVGGRFYYGDAWPLPKGAFAHPRSAGCFTKFLREYVRERRLVSLLDAVRKCSLTPAQVLEHAVPQMKSKGRLQAGADADLIIFDADAVTDRATFREPNQPAEGMRHVIVDGTFVIRDGKLDTTARPGRPIRRAVAEHPAGEQPSRPH